MRTEELVALLASGVEPVEVCASSRHRKRAFIGGFVGSVAVALVFLRLNPALHAYLGRPMFWVREAYCLLLSAGGFAAVGRLCRAEGRLGLLPVAIGTVILTMWTLALFALRDAGPGHARVLVLGSTAAACPGLITLLALPPLVAAIGILREGAPTRLRVAGSSAGFAAGSMGALVYTLHCPEIAAPFIGIWYLTGILIPTALGFLIGWRALRW